MSPQLCLTLIALCAQVLIGDARGRHLTPEQLSRLVAARRETFSPRSHEKGDEYLPGTQAQEFSVSTLDGQFVVSPGSMGAALYVMAWNASDPFTSVMWTTNASVQYFVEDSPMNATYLFLSYANSTSVATATATWMRGRLSTTMQGLGWNSTAIRQWLSRAYFSAEPVQSLAPFVNGLLQNWTSPVEQLVVAAGPGLGTAFNRLDARYMWLNWPEIGSNGTVVAVAGSPCLPFAANVSGALALVQWMLDANESSPCSVAEVVLNAQNAGAQAVILINAEGRPYFDMNCDGADCNLPVSIPASQVSYTDGQMLLGFLSQKETSPVILAYEEAQVPGFFFGIDETGLLFEMGWEKIATLSFLSWQAQWQGYASELRANLSSPALVISIVTQATMQGSPGIIANVTLPPLSELAAFDTMELDFALSCPTPYQESCAVWDRTLELTVCCQPDIPDENAAPFCGTELGRWITPFRRGIGRWLTDVSPLFPLLTGRECSFNLYTDSWAMPWVDSLSLRFRNSTSALAMGHSPEFDSSLTSGKRSTGNLLSAYTLQPQVLDRPKQLVPLYSGTQNFNSSYNTNRNATLFTAPTWLTRALLYTVITGHGSDNNGCGEFCVTSHVFFVNGHANNLTFDDAGTEWGCTSSIPDGGIPNEHGTWFLGRDGWCDGQAVRPWVIDITAQLVPSPEVNNVSYVGLFQGATPNPTTPGAVIIMQSFVSLYGALNGNATTGILYNQEGLELAVA